MSHVDFPSRDAAAYYSDSIGAAEHEARIAAEAIARTRPAREAMKLPWLSEREAASLIDGLIHVISNSNFKHTQAAQSALDSLVDAHFYLESAQGEK